MENTPLDPILWGKILGGGGSVTSVNGKTGPVVLTAADVGALPDDTPIPAAVTEQTVSGWGFTKNTGTYSKPSGGIPKSDLANDVQTSLGKADTALQSVPSGYATETWVTNKGYQTAAQVQTAISGKAEKSALDAHTGNTTIHVTAANKTAWNGKQDAISDLATIRSGAAAGATAVQPGSLATVATSGSYNDLSNKPTIPTVPTAEISANTAARHTHSNKSLLDTYAQTEANLAAAVSKKHSHSNKTVLDGITAAKLLPAVTTSDNDKFLRVVSGAWAAATVPSAESEAF